MIVVLVARFMEVYIKRFLHRLRNFDLIMLSLTIILMVIGVVVLYASTVKVDGIVVDISLFNQLLYCLLGLGLMFVVAATDYRLLKNYTRPAYIISLGLLIIVEIAGATRLGATRWINFGIVQFQPSELAKIALIIVLAKFMSTNYDRLHQIKYLLLSLVYLLLPLGLVLVQPDLGTGLVLVVIWLSMVLASRVRKRHILMLVLIFTAFAPLLYQFLAPYQKQRLLTFINPTADPLGAGYNVYQATIAIGSGQLFGQGLGSGSQSQLNYLPVQHTDFIFAVLAEKLGFVGSGLVLLLFGALLFRIANICANSRDSFGMFIGVGIMAMLTFHILINIGMNLGVLPVTGIPLPFISAGGTSLVVALACMGLLQSIASRSHKRDHAIPLQG